MLIGPIVTIKNKKVLSTQICWCFRRIGAISLPRCLCLQEQPGWLLWQSPDRDSEGFTGWHTRSVSVQDDSSLKKSLDALFYFSSLSQIPRTQWNTIHRPRAPSTFATTWNSVRSRILHIFTIYKYIPFTGFGIFSCKFKGFLVTTRSLN